MSEKKTPMQLGQEIVEGYTRCSMLCETDKQVLAAVIAEMIQKAKDHTQWSALERIKDLTQERDYWGKEALAATLSFKKQFDCLAHHLNKSTVERDTWRTEALAARKAIDKGISNTSLQDEIDYCAARKATDEALK